VRAARAAQARGYEVVAVSGQISGETPVPLDGIEIVRVGRPARINRLWLGASTGARTEGPLLRELRSLARLARMLVRSARIARAARRLPSPSVVHANDLDTLPAAYLLARENGSRLVYDAHELYGEFDPDPPRLARAALNALERVLARRADAVVTVSDEIADELARRLRVRPLVVLNAPTLDEQAPPEPDADGPLRVVYQGAFGTGRPLADLVEILRNAPSVRLTLRVNRSTREQLARELPGDVAARVEVVDPVAPADVVRALHGHHAGLLFDRPLTRNAELSSPNKLFEYLMAGLAVVAPRLPGLRWIEDERLGLLGPTGDPPALGEVLERLAGDRALLAELRANARRAAVERYNAEAQRPVLERAWRR
jgi:glycosyltransferase involved in cell wall biosynthesis